MLLTSVVPPPASWERGQQAHADSIWCLWRDQGHGLEVQLAVHGESGCSRWAELVTAASCQSLMRSESGSAAPLQLPMLHSSLQSLSSPVLQARCPEQLLTASVFRGRNGGRRVHRGRCDPRHWGGCSRPQPCCLRDRPLCSRYSSQPSVLARGATTPHAAHHMHGNASVLVRMQTCQARLSHLQRTKMEALQMLNSLAAVSGLAWLRAK